MVMMRIILPKMAIYTDTRPCWVFDGCIWGLGSISRKTSYHHTSWSLEAARFQNVYSKINIKSLADRWKNLMEIYNILQLIILWPLMAPSRVASRRLWTNSVNMVLPVSGLDDAKVNHSAVFCMFGLNRNPPVPPYKLFNDSQNL